MKYTNFLFASYFLEKISIYQTVIFPFTSNRIPWQDFLRDSTVILMIYILPTTILDQGLPKKSILDNLLGLGKSAKL